ncbi:MAG TPA: TraM recognition domain-containing protein, partial [Bryobacteraceae bacterium]|nr:TraM recognition domain-containing protein [Bryobacteraceae bacterium]
MVNLAPSDYLSHENAAVFGALLVNEFFECAMRRDTKHGDPKAFYLYLDEFQSFVSPAIASMLDQIRKFGIFLTLAHQRFGQLDEDIIDAVLTNCKIKAVFGGLRAESAEMMARELFIGKLDPMKIKAAIYQTKFWPTYSRDKVYTHGTSHGRSSSTSSSTGGSDTSSSSISTGSSQAYFYDDWFSMPQLSGTRTETAS